MICEFIEKYFSEIFYNLQENNYLCFFYFINMNIYITWHYTTHGIAYLKHIISWFYKENTLQPPSVPAEKLEQDELNNVFDVVKKGRKFDKVFYLTAEQDVFSRISSRSYSYKNNYKEDDVIKENDLVNVFDGIRNNKDLCYNLDKEIQWVKENYKDKLPEFEKFLWRDIQHYDIATQIKWLKENTNFSKVYCNDEFKEVKLGVKDLRDIEDIVNKVKDFVTENISPEDNCVINISLGSAETEVAWFILADNDILPANTSFIQTYDNKRIEGKRFKPFAIKQVPIKLINDVRTSFDLFEETKSHKRELVNKLFNKYLYSGFPVLLLGERGIGKSYLVSKSWEGKKEKLVEANCASFTDNDIAESELFGYVEGAYTGALKLGSDGLIKNAEDGVLFLDEVHYLSKLMQAKLMKAFQTDAENNFRIRPVGAKKEIVVKNVKLVFATNHNIEQLKEDLLPDFYDRIVQYVVEIPPLRETREDLKNDCKAVLNYLYPPSKDKGSEKFSRELPDELLKWIKKLELKGNYRDLQNIIRYYHIFEDFDEDVQKEVCSKLEIKKCNAIDFAKKNYETYHMVSPSKEKFVAKVDLEDPSNIKNNILSQLRDWLIDKYGSNVEAAKALGITPKTLYNWGQK